MTQAHPTEIVSATRDVTVANETDMFVLNFRIYSYDQTPHFAVTGTHYYREEGAYTGVTRWRGGGGGAVGDRAAKMFPALERFTRWHLTKYDGTPHGYPGSPFYWAGWSVVKGAIRPAGYLKESLEDRKRHFMSSIVASVKSGVFSTPEQLWAMRERPHESELYSALLVRLDRVLRPAFLDDMNDLFRKNIPIEGEVDPRAIKNVAEPLTPQRFIEMYGIEVSWKPDGHPRNKRKMLDYERNRYACTITANGVIYETAFECHRTYDVTAADIFSAVILDASCYADSCDFDDFCANLGYDTELTEQYFAAQNVYKACEHAYTALGEMLAKDVLDIALYEMERL